LVVLGASQSRSKKDQRFGWILAAAGAATLVADVGSIIGIDDLGGTLLTLSGIGLLATGGYNLYQFMRNLRRRM
jgi:hypothetical protein